MGSIWWNKPFSPKKWSKNTLFGGHGSGSSDFGVGWDPQFSRYRWLPHVFRIMWNISFEMSYVEGVNLQNCPIGGRLNFFLVGTQKNAKKTAKKTIFFIKRSFPKICSKKPISRLGPCESWRPELSENVGLIGRVTFLTGVIGRQRWMSRKKLIRHQK